jgi:hypothetical protein
MDGVLKAMRKMQEEKVVKYLGITGHTVPKPMPPYRTLPI